MDQQQRKGQGQGQGQGAFVVAKNMTTATLPLHSQNNAVVESLENERYGLTVYDA